MADPYRSLDEGTAASLRRMWLAGVTAKDIRKQLSTSERTLKRWAIELGLPARAPTNFDWDRPGVEERARAAYEAGTPARLIAAELGGVCTEYAVRSRARLRGWEPPIPALSRKVEPDKATKRAARPRPAPKTAKILADAEAGDCRFPVGPSDPMRMDKQLFCCAPAEPGIPYCAKCAKRAYSNWGRQ